MELTQPKDTLQIVRIDLSQGRPSNYLQAKRLGMPDGESPLGWLYMSLLAGGKSDYLENKISDHENGKASFTMPTTVALALCTVVPEDSKTGATITEASYTGYARKKIEATALNASSSGKTTSSAILEFAACTASSSTIIGWATCDSSTKGEGNMLLWGSVGSTVISTSATPATVNAGAYETTED